MAYNDETAAEVVGAAIRLGVRIPQELSVVGHDDAPIASLMVPSITTVRVDNVGIGRYMGELAKFAYADDGDPRDIQQP
ncbi:substrate-binding domain-containing protein, partial [Klebsiella pneumoniae]|uniref:substrate-binding domain-containing protein n=1 Tax=Klebsiella pneumoniae TaxID=573 RepID=UPI0021630A0D